MKQTIPRRPTGNSAPLSFAQQRLWFLNQLEPGSPVYNVCRGWRLSGRLNVEALQKTIDAIVARHEVLRSIVRVIDGEPHQVPAATLGAQLSMIDLLEFSPAERELEAQQLALTEAKLPFDLERGPLFRPKLLRVANEEHVLLLNLHHIVTDGWSIGVLYREIAALYEAFIAGRTSPLPQLPIQYSDYTLWQRERLQGDSLEEQLTYWKRQLADLPVLGLPTDRPRPPLQSHRGARELFRLSPTLIAQLKGLSQGEGVTLFMTLLAAFNVLLFRYTGQADIVVGSPIAGRTRVETEGLIGFFVNTLVLRTELSGNPSFRELLQRVRDVALQAYEHQELPFEKLVETLRPDRDLSHTPLFNVMFQLRNLPQSNVKIPGLGVDPISLDIGVARFDLSLEVEDTQKGLECTFEYSTDLFERTTILRLAGHLQTLLENIAANPDQRLSEIPILRDAERQQLLLEWNDTKRDYPRDTCLHQLFEKQVERTPDAVAVVFEERRLTYRELNRRANQLAHYLRSLGVGPEVRVGICMERSVEMVIGLLGILKAGGAYVPLDPAYPKERLAFMLDDSKATALLTQESLLAGVPEHKAQVVRIDSDYEGIGQKSEKDPASEVTADNLAYLIYTSGSTGRPKGVAIEHRSPATLLHWARGVFPPEDLAGVLASTSVCFDLSVFELFVPLSSGGKVILAENALEVPNLSAATEVTLINTVPSAITKLLDRMPASVRTVNLAGEPLSTALVEQLYQRGTIKRVYDLYGPSEDTTYSTFALRRSQGPTTIGRPIANTQVYVLDNHLSPVPIGVFGELYIGGEGLARGYCNNPELTAEKFLPHPFSGGPGERVYRTGDLARYLDDGNIEFLGRIDHQVKIRGYRIELGEVESVLSQHPAVRECVVISREEVEETDYGVRVAEGVADNPQSAIANPKFTGKRLVSYVVPRQEEVPSISELKSFLMQKLPEYMVPSAFVFLDRLPITPNGKIDRKALPIPDQGRPKLEEVYVAPRTPVEEIIAEIWAEVLKVHTVGAHDNFFDLGGHSLLATQAMSRIRRVLKVELPLHALFERPTVAELAKRIKEAHGEGQTFVVRPMVPVSRDKELPLSFSQQRLWFLDQYEPNSSVYNLPSVVRLRGSLDIGALEWSLNEIIRRHESLRTAFSMVGGAAVQVIGPSVGRSLAVVDLKDRPEGERDAEARRLAKEEALRPFDLACGPMFRTSLIRLGEDDHVLLLTMHHIVSDGWSMGILYRELSMLYRAFVNGESSPLADLSIQYADFAVWQRDWLQGEALECQQSYWKKHLEGAPAVLNLPTDRPRPAVQTYRGARSSFELSKELTEGLKALSRKEGVTLFMTLLAAFRTLLYRYTGQEDIVVGSPIANRNRGEIEGLIGFFVNTLALRTDLSGNPTFGEMLQRVRMTALEAYEHQDLPFEKLVEELKLERNSSYSPLFQVMFVLQNTPGTALKLHGLKVTPVRLDGETAKFDLTVYMSESVDGLRGLLEYNTDLFDEATIIRMLGHWQVLLEGLVANPDQRIGYLPLLTDAEQRQLVSEWNDTRKDYPKDKCIHQLFEEQVENNPEAVAVVSENEQLTYRELNTRANQLAHYLREQGVGPESLVGICVDRSLEMVVGLLGILKAGGAYVPLDPEYPTERLVFTLEDTRAPILLTQARLVEKLPALNARLVCLDRDWPQISEETEENPESKVTADNTAYVIYTSGTTGKPKGVMISHHNVSRLFRATEPWFLFSEADVWTVFHSCAFDFSVWELWGALLYGGRAVIVPYWISRSPEQFYELLYREQVTVLNQTPSAFRQLIQADQSVIDQPKLALRSVILGGEALDFQTLQPWFDRHGDECPRLVNMYGITETTVHVTYRVVRASDIKPGIGSLIGVPIPDLELFVLDKQGQLVPIGVPGELHIGGAGVGRGYLNRPQLTAERFLLNPFSKTGKLYKTGDLARRLSTGEIEYLGRIDDQVKIRGFRIEPGEIEAVLSQHPALKETVVVAWEEVENPKSESGNSKSAIPNSQCSVKRLVAYAVLKSGQTLDATEARLFLKRKLPEYMVPLAFVFLDSFPLTPNGKVNRKALPAPDEKRPELQVSYVAPRNPVEEVLAGICAEVLKVEKVGIHDNFFEVGGHSLLATQVMARVRGAFQVDVPLRVLFEKPTIGELATTIAGQRVVELDGEEFSSTLAELESLSEEETQHLLLEQETTKV
jgi:amino acid adenylation domain-containing protein